MENMFISQKDILFDRSPHVGPFCEDECNVPKDRVVRLWTGLNWLMTKLACIFLT